MSIIIKLYFQSILNCFTWKQSLQLNAPMYSTYQSFSIRKLHLCFETLLLPILAPFGSSFLLQSNPSKTNKREHENRRLPGKKK